MARVPMFIISKQLSWLECDCSIWLIWRRMHSVELKQDEVKLINGHDPIAFGSVRTVPYEECIYEIALINSIFISFPLYVFCVRGNVYHRRNTILQLEIIILLQSHEYFANSNWLFVCKANSTWILHRVKYDECLAWRTRLSLVFGLWWWRRLKRSCRWWWTARKSYISHSLNANDDYDYILHHFLSLEFHHNNDNTVTGTFAYMSPAAVRVCVGSFMRTICDTIQQNLHFVSVFKIKSNYNL